MNSTTTTPEISPAAADECEIIKHEGLKMTLRRIRTDGDQTKRKRGKTESSERPRKIRRVNDDKENTKKNKDPRRLNVPHKGNTHALDVRGNLYPRVSNETPSLKIPRMTGPCTSNVPQKEAGYTSKVTQKTETRFLKEPQKISERKGPRPLNVPQRRVAYPSKVTEKTDTELLNEPKKTSLTKCSRPLNILQGDVIYPMKVTQKTGTQFLKQPQKNGQRKDPRPFNVSLHTDPHYLNVPQKADVLGSILPQMGDPLTLDAPWKADIQLKQGNISLSSGINESEEFKKEISEKHKERTNADERKMSFMLKKSTWMDKRCNEFKKQQELSKKFQNHVETKPNFPRWDPLGLSFSTASPNEEQSPHNHEDPPLLQLSFEKEVQRKREQLERRRLVKLNESNIRILHQEEIMKDFEEGHTYFPTSTRNEP